MFANVKNIIETNNRIKVKIYSLEYIKKQEDNQYIIYAIYCSNKKSKYESLDDLFSSYTIYNEPLDEIIERIVLLNEKKLREKNKVYCELNYF